MRDARNNLVDIAGLQKLITQLRKRLFIDGTCKSSYWGTQVRYDSKAAIDPKYQVDFINEKRELGNDALIDHFLAEPFRRNHYLKGAYTAGSIGIMPLQKDDQTTFFCMDVDYEEQLEPIVRFLPELDRLGIRYIYETAGARGDRMHIWFFVRTQKDVLKTFIETMLGSLGIDWVKLKLELYPTHKPTSLIRLFLGYHIKSAMLGLHPVNGIRIGDEIVTDPMVALPYILSLPDVDEQVLIDYIVKYSSSGKELEDDPFNIMVAARTPDAPKKKHRVDIYRKNPNLSNPFNYDLPEVFEKTLQCQAIHGVLKKIKDQDTLFLNDNGDTVHKMGVFLHGYAKWNDHYRLGGEGTEGADFMDYLKEEYRFRPSDDHNWTWEKPHEDGRPQFYTPGCDKLNDILHACEGCPLKNIKGFKTPLDLVYMERLRYQLTSRTKGLKTNEDMSERAQQRTWSAVINGLKANVVDPSAQTIIGVRTPQGTYKSTKIIDEQTVKLVRSGRRVIISVLDGKQASEHADRLIAAGMKPFVLRGHKNQFKFDNPGFDCPDAAAIQELAELGVARSQIKNKFCSKCPFRESCPYPDQFNNLKNENPEIVIIQHAHLAIPEIMGQLVSMNYHVLYLDEEFYSSLKKYHKVDGTEGKFLFHYAKEHKWLRPLYRWLQGGRPGEDFKPTTREMQELKQYMLYHSQPWKVSDYKRAYDSKQMYIRKRGIFQFTPISDSFPVVVMTSATLPEQITRIVFGGKPIQFIGGWELTDVTFYDSENKNIKIIGGSSSVTAHSDIEYFLKKLHYIGKKVRESYSDLKTLVVVYSDQIDMVTRFYKQYYPDVADSITVDLMSVGSNTYRFHNIQFLLAEVNFNAVDYGIACWEIGNVANYYNHSLRGTHMVNPYPAGVKPGDSVKSMWVPTQFYLKIEGEERAVLIKFPQLPMPKPVHYMAELVHLSSLGKTQQAARLRQQVPGTCGSLRSDLRVFYDWSNQYRPGLVYTDFIAEHEIIDMKSSD